jgi:prolyl-tRNA synthetase
MVLTSTETGENDVFYCENCDYNANSNRATSVLLEPESDGGFTQLETLDTHNVKTIEELEKFLKVEKKCILKAVLYIYDSKPVMVMLRGDKEVEETKLLNALGCLELRKATDDEAKEYAGCEAGYISYIGLENVKVVFDRSAQGMKNFVAGANRPHKHFVGCNFAQTPDFIDISVVKAGEKCIECGSSLNVTRGIEVGNIFQLGTKYSEPMGATYAAEDGSEKPYIMGCYGIGITRVAATAVEKYHDDFGIVWPLEIAPYHVVVVPVNSSDTTQMNVANDIYEKLSAVGVEVILDDREDRAGVKFKDADLIGIPYRITVGKTIADGLVEFKSRKSADVATFTPDDVINKVIVECQEVL